MPSSSFPDSEIIERRIMLRWLRDSAEVLRNETEHLRDTEPGLCPGCLGDALAETLVDWWDEFDTDTVGLGHQASHVHVRDDEGDVLIFHSVFHDTRQREVWVQGALIDGMPFIPDGF